MQDLESELGLNLSSLPGALLRELHTGFLALRTSAFAQRRAWREVGKPTWLISLGRPWTGCVTGLSVVALRVRSPPGDSLLCSLVTSPPTFLQPLGAETPPPVLVPGSRALSVVSPPPFCRPPVVNNPPGISLI